MKYLKYLVILCIAISSCEVEEPNEPINEENLILERTLSQSATTIIIPQYRGLPALG
ncbi:MAG: hypothetical protein AAF489_02570 [Bacteroidota bacterium]